MTSQLQGIGSIMSVEDLLRLLAPCDLKVECFADKLSKSALSEQVNSLERLRNKEIQKVQMKYWGEIGPVFEKLLNNRAKLKEMTTSEKLICYLSANLQTNTITELKKLCYIEQRRVLYGSKLATKIEYAPLMFDF